MIKYRVKRLQTFFLFQIISFPLLHSKWIKSRNDPCLLVTSPASQVWYGGEAVKRRRAASVFLQRLSPLNKDFFHGKIPI